MDMGSVATAIFRASRPAIPRDLGRQRRAVKMEGVLYSRKIYEYNSKESPPSIKVTRNLVVCESFG